MKCLILLSFLVLSACDGSSGGTDPKRTNVPGSGIGDFSGVVAIRPEIEPNNSIAMADAITLPTPTNTDDYIGFQITGTINGLTDSVDTFSFTSSRIRTFDIDLCDGCGHILEDGNLAVSVIYFDVLDQTGNVLLSTRRDFVNGNHQDIAVAAGALYYIMLIAPNTGDTSQDYTLHVVEELPF